MRRISIFILLFLLIPFIFSFSKSLKANDDFSFYKPGEFIRIHFLCSDLDRLLKVVEADAQDLDQAANLMQLLFKFQKCIKLPKWTVVSIKEIVVAYKDAKQRNSYLLEVYTPMITPKDIETKEVLKTYVLIMEPHEMYTPQGIKI
jgi:hypothetical protein